jgi:hypothetical protein
MAEHTPTPWICDSDAIMPISRDGVSIVARIPNHPDNKMNWAADAEFIIRAVNAHDAIVAALKVAEDVLSRAPFSTGVWPNGMHPNTGIEQIRAAISLSNPPQERKAGQ